MKSYYEELESSIEEVLSTSDYKDIIMDDIKILIKNYMDNNILKSDVSKIIDKIIERN